MRIFNKVVIIGTGLIGGSIGLAMKKRGLAKIIVGLSRLQKNAIKAKKIGAIDIVGRSIEAVSDADLVILATPIDTIIDIALKFSKKIKKNCIVIDVGSTKEKIVSKLSRVIPNFLGCHPLAGSEKRGIVNFKAGIFKDSICVITPTNKTNKGTLKKIKLLWKELGALLVILTPKKHDQILALTSHLPHAIAFSLIGTIPDQFLNLSSTGLKDTTRIAGSDANIWNQVFLSNRKNLISAISSFQKKLKNLELALKNNNKKQLIGILNSAKKKREKLE